MEHDKVCKEEHKKPFSKEKIKCKSASSWREESTVVCNPLGMSEISIDINDAVLFLNIFSCGQFLKTTSKRDISIITKSMTFFLFLNNDVLRRTFRIK